HRFKTTGASQFDAGCNRAIQAYVFDDLMLTVTLFDQLRPSGAAKRSTLAQVRPEIDHTGAELLLKIHRMELQLSDFDEHRELPRPHLNRAGRGSMLRRVTAQGSRT